jgi:hypothetical protein
LEAEWAAAFFLRSAQRFFMASPLYVRAGMSSLLFLIEKWAVFFEPAEDR